jgi:hypothetical protein
MTRPRDPDIMAMDHAVQAILKSTPRMLKLNIEFVIYILQRILKELPRC